MLTLSIALGSLLAFVLAYRIYGEWIGRRVFRLDAQANAPSHALRDNVDFVPTRLSVIFGHHFTSIAGTGPIVGPAIAVFWGWLPALAWVLLGSIFVGAVHDFGALVVSLRSEGQTIGEVAGRLISPRAKVLFLLVLFFALTVVLGIFGLVIAILFNLYPESVLSVWIAMPMAVLVGLLVYKRGVGLLVPSLIALVLLYAAVIVGAYAPELGLNFKLPAISRLGSYGSPVVMWTFLLLGYCYVASVLPVWLLLQPRDYINSHQLYVALALLMGGLCVASFSGQADLNAAPMIATEIPADAPPIFPFLFITIACGACSGFHCLVSSGTTSKQLDSEQDALAVGYGAMLLEGGLAVVVILACCAGLGMGVTPKGQATRLTGQQAWQAMYQAKITPVVDAAGQPVLQNGKPVTQGGWNNHKLGKMVGAFVEGGANFVSTLGLPRRLAVAIIAVLVACFAATTLDTATRLQRYVIQELGAASQLAPLTNKYVATALAVVTGGGVAMIDGGSGPGSGGLILWPLFGATNQLLAGLALIVLVFYLLRRNLPVWFAAAPMLLMLLMPGWAMVQNLLQDFLPNGNWLLVGFASVLLALEAWMLVEALLILPKVRGVLEPALPPRTHPTGEQAS